ncbi:MAG: hypothetical protein D6696_00440 [Acidobacteria bacterium]|nr:MAG: hypothetical protein D6696_00440 [Acidobacteriota bacterium]
MARTLSIRWPRIPFLPFAFFARLAAAIALYFVAAEVVRLAEQTSLLVPSDDRLIWLSFVILLVLLFLPELYACLRFVASGAYWIGTKLLTPQARGDGRLGRRLLKAYRWASAALVNLLSFPIRTYYKPSLAAILGALLLHWFTVTFVVWLAEVRHAGAGSPFVHSPLAGQLTDSLIKMAMMLAGKGFDYPPQSTVSRVVILVGLVIFLVLLVFYGSAFNDSRRRLAHRRLKGKPRFLPLFGHLLVSGEIPAVRMLLHQFEHYDLSQDVVVAGESSATAAVAGLSRLEPHVWAVEGNLWEAEVRHAADARRANCLVVTSVEAAPLDATRTLLAVEADNQEIRSVIDTRQCQKSIIECALRERRGTSPAADRDFFLDWGARHEAFLDDLKRVPYLTRLLRELLSRRPRDAYPRHFNLVRRSRFGPLHRLEETRLLTMIPLCLPADDPSLDDWRSLAIEGDSLLRAFFHSAASSEGSGTPLPGAGEIEIRSVFREPEACDDCKKIHRLHNGKIAAAADHDLLQELCSEEAWKTATTKRLLVEFHQPDAAESFLAICRRNGREENVEAYSDLEMRTLLLALAVILEDDVCRFLDALWPIEAEKRTLRFASRELEESDCPGGSISFRELVRKLREASQSPIACRPAGGAQPRYWIPCPFGDDLRPGDEILVLERVFPDPAH